MRALILLLLCFGCALFQKERTFPGAKEGHLVVAVDRTKSIRHHDPKDRGLDLLGRVTALLPPLWRVSEMVLTDEPEWLYTNKTIKAKKDRDRIYEAAKIEPEGTGSLTRHLSSILRRAADQKAPQKDLLILTDSDLTPQQAEKVVKKAKKAGVRVISVPTTVRTENPGLKTLSTESGGFFLHTETANRIAPFESLLRSFWPKDRLFTLLSPTNKPFSLPPSCYRLLLLTEGATLTSFRILIPKGAEKELKRSHKSVSAYPKTPHGDPDVVSVNSPAEGTWQPIFYGKPKAQRVFAVMPFRVIVTWKPLKKGAKEIVLSESKLVTAKEGDVVVLSAKIVPDKGVEEIGAFLRDVKRIVVVPVGGGEETEVPFISVQKEKASQKSKTPAKRTIGTLSLKHGVSVEWPIYVLERKKDLFEVVVYTCMRLKGTTWENIRRFRMKLEHATKPQEWILVERGTPRQVKEKVTIRMKHGIREEIRTKTVWEWEVVMPGSGVDFTPVWRGQKAGPVRLRFTNKTAMPLELRAGKTFSGIPQNLKPRQKLECELSVATLKEVPKSVELAIFIPPQKPGQKSQHITDYPLALNIPVAELKLPRQPIEIVWPSAKHSRFDGKDGKLNFALQRVFEESVVSPTTLPIRVEKVTSNLKGLTGSTLFPAGKKAAFRALLPESVKDGRYRVEMVLSFDGIWKVLGKKRVSFNLVVNRDPDVEVEVPGRLVARFGEPLIFDVVLVPKRLPMPWPQITVTAQVVAEEEGKGVAVYASSGEVVNDLTGRLRLRLVGFATEDPGTKSKKAKVVVRLRYLNQTTTIQKPLEIVWK